MKSHYTPGPWEVSDAPTKCHVRAHTSQRPIANCETPGNTWPQDRCNALLIAAAPELLGALKALMAAYESVLPGIGSIAVKDYKLLNDAPVAAERAIAKAEGRS